MREAKDRPFVVVSGLPGSGKTTLARRLAAELSLPLIDKDDILERLFESKGTGDPVWRRTLSRESDDLLQSEARASRGAASLQAQAGLGSLDIEPAIDVDTSGEFDVDALIREIQAAFARCPTAACSRRPVDS